MNNSWRHQETVIAPDSTRQSKKVLFLLHSFCILHGHLLRKAICWNPGLQGWAEVSVGLELKNVSRLSRGTQL